MFLLFQFDFSSADKLQLGNKISWIKSINANYEIGIDGISLPLLVLSTFITVLAIIYSIEHLPEPKSPKGFLALILVLETGMNGTFVALDLPTSVDLATNKLMATTLSAMAEFENNRRKEPQKQGIRVLSKKGNILAGNL